MCEIQDLGRHWLVAGIHLPKCHSRRPHPQWCRTPSLNKIQTSKLLKKITPVLSSWRRKLAMETKPILRTRLFISTLELDILWESMGFDRVWLTRSQHQATISTNSCWYFHVCSLGVGNWRLVIDTLVQQKSIAATTLSGSKTTKWPPRAFQCVTVATQN